MTPITDKELASLHFYDPGANVGCVCPECEINAALRSDLMQAIARAVNRVRWETDTPKECTDFLTDLLRKHGAIKP
jgi:hypothetical protein